MSEPEIHPADPAVRRNTFVALPFAAVLLYLVWRGFQAYLDGLATDTTAQLVESSEQVVDALVQVLLGGAALLALLAGFWDSLARRIDAAGRYPFAQARLFHDMAILRGAAAAVYARRTARGAWVALVLAYALLAGAVLLPQYFARQHPLLVMGHIVTHIHERGGNKP